MRIGGGEVTQYEVIMKTNSGLQSIGFSRSGKNGIIFLIRNSKKAQEVLNKIEDEAHLKINGGGKKIKISVGNVEIYFSGKTEKGVLNRGE